MWCFPKKRIICQRGLIQQKKISFWHWDSVRFPLAAFLLTILVLKITVIQNLDGWDENTSRNVAGYILPEENTTLIYPSQLSPDAFSEYDIVIFVMSAPKNAEQRNAIRQTWGSVNKQDSDLRMCLTFLMGLTTNNEVR